jgi:hypothetical protein
MRKTLSVFCLFGIILSHTLASATAIIVVVKSDGIWIGADGLRHHNEGGVNSWHSVCKLHQVYDGLLFKYGDVENPDDVEHSFNTDVDVQSAIRTNETFGTWIHLCCSWAASN